MYSAKTTRILLSFLLIFGVFSSFALPSVQADTSSAVTLSPVIIAKLDAFLVKVQALRAKYPSDADWNTFLNKLNSKIGALKILHDDKPLILSVLNRLDSGVMGLKNTIASASSIDNEDLCAKEGLDNIDENNFSTDKYIVSRGLKFLGHDYDLRNFAYKMGQGQSYSFPLSTNSYTIPSNVKLDANGNIDITDPNWSPLSFAKGNKLWVNAYLSPYTNVFNISEKKCDFVTIKQKSEYAPVSNYTVAGNSPCAGSYGNDFMLDIAVDAKFSDPNYKPTYGSIEAGACRLLPNKKYYINVRWMRKSDLVDASGKIKDDSNPLFSEQRASLRSKTITELNKYLSDTFNGHGDSCLLQPASTDGIANHRCVIDYSFDYGFPPLMPKLNAQGMQAKAAENKRLMDATIQAQDAATYDRNHPELRPTCVSGILPEDGKSCNCPAGTTMMGPYGYRKCTTNSVTNTTGTQSVGGTVSTTPPAPQCQSGGSSATLQWKCGCTSSPGSGWVLQDNGCYHHSP